MISLTMHKNYSKILEWKIQIENNTKIYVFECKFLIKEIKEQLFIYMLILH